MHGLLQQGTREWLELSIIEPLFYTVKPFGEVDGRIERRTRNGPIDRGHSSTRAVLDPFEDHITPNDGHP